MGLAETGFALKISMACGFALVPLSQSYAQIDRAASLENVRETRTVGESGDPIRPVRIEHKVDDVVVDGEIIERYIVIDYEFERDDAFILARANLSEPQIVSIYGPYRSDDRQTRATAAELENSVLTYLQRRYEQINRFDDRPEADPPFQIVWRRSQAPFRANEDEHISVR